MKPQPKPTVVRDAAWLKELRQRPCHFGPLGNCNPYTTMGKGYSEVSHLDGKSRDDRAQSACGGHHRTNLISWHSGQKSFLKHYGLDKDVLIAEAELAYTTWKEGR